MKKIIFTTICLLQSLIASDIYATFDVVAEKNSDLGLSISGVVGILHVNVGDKVKKGDVLLSLNNAQEKKELEIAQKNAEHAKRTYERYAKIADVIDKEKMENYAYDRDINLLNAQNKEIVVRKTELRAPYDLVVAQKNTEIGNIVLGSQTKLLNVVSLDDVKLVLKFDEKYWKSIKLGQKFTYKVDGSDAIFEGKITKIYPTILAATREMQAEVKANGLMPGLFGNGTISVE